MTNKEQMANVRKNFIKKADGVVFVCEKDNEKSVSNLFMWKNLIEDNCDKSIPMVVVMNKIDKLIQNEE